mgnify:CR=1 FL=1
MICVDLERIAVSQPDKPLFADVSLTVSTAQRVALVGINGSGKTTLLRIVAGALAPDAGTVRFGRGVRIATLAQDPVLPAGTVGDHLGDHWETAAVATSLGVGSLLERRTDQLSGGQAKRVALAAALVGEHDLVVLDEPTNHLDLEAIEWLEDRLARTSAALVIVTHDRHLMDRLTTARGDGTVVELDAGEAHLHRARQGESAYAAFLAGRAERLAAAADAEATRRILARRELAWLRRGAPARSSKPKARLRSAREIVGGGAARDDVRSSELLADVSTRRLGNQVVALEGVGQRLGDDEPIDVFDSVDLVVEPGARIGVVGPNGAGKTTLLDIVAGRTEPASGEVRRGSTVVTGYVDQHGVDLPGDAIVRELVAGPHRQPDWRDRRLLERFWFDSTAQYAPVRMLSGGERRRLQLVMTLADAPNLLVLDEPTNDLDLDTLRALEEFLDDWPGALVVASHDRTFLDRTVDHVLALEPGGIFERVPGGVAGWLERRAARRAGPSRQPSRGDTRATRRDGPSPSTVNRRLRETEKVVERLSARVARLADELTGVTDRDEIARLGAELTAAQTELTSAETTWLELADQL